VTRSRRRRSPAAGQHYGDSRDIIAQPTVVNAIEHALVPVGVRIYEQHLPPARILELLADAEAG
jgi:hypothetical protein